MLSQARKNANKKWDSENKNRVNYLKDRSKAKSFIEKKAKKEDLLELQDLIKSRLNLYEMEIEKL